ncbi:MAG: HAMP domain-containing histidine kinase [Deltaproteobacteria bacterium]|nr:HAMP domain-containing histidine kinase [Deltaproteobacteria bacterium]
MRFPPASVQLRRAQLILMLVVLIPTVLLTVIGLVLLVSGQGTAFVVVGILVLTLTATGITGYILVSIFVGKGASLVRLQNSFMSSVSHELRTPLTSMRLFMESLKNNRLTKDDQHKVVELLGGEIDRLDALVGRVLELSRIESGGHAFQPTTFLVADLVTEAVSAFDAATLARPTTIAIDVEPGLTMIGDRATLVRALVNLLVNAWKYSDDDKRIVVIARGIGRHIELGVRDNGIGIAASERSAIFDEFHRAPEAYNRGAPGVGLGLAFVRAIARAHKGKVVVESGPGIGSQFTLRLKRARVMPDQAQARPPSTAAATR